MTSTDDLPWPELGNVSRGATRGNQGQKGALGPPDRDGHCVLQLRVQPGVLAVKLNQQASEWYRTLDNEVNRALKLTKTYWRKARRRQDYDARADQDHMELHEWLQQLKDKTMSHLELLMQKGDIQGPPYVMGDEIELTFLRGFIERHAAGIPHNPRLRNGTAGDNSFSLRDPSVESTSPDPSDGYADQISRPLDMTETQLLHTQRGTASPAIRNSETMLQEANNSKQALQLSRAALTRAQKETQDAFLKYTACLDVERTARQSVVAAEKRRDDIMAALLSMNQALPVQQPSQPAASIEGHHHTIARYHVENPANSDLKSTRTPGKSLEWPDPESQNVFASDAVAHIEDSSFRGRKHSRGWEAQQAHLQEAYHCEDILPPRKRIHHMMPGYDVMNNPIMAQSMTLQT